MVMLLPKTSAKALLLAKITFQLKIQKAGLERQIGTGLHSAIPGLQSNQI